MAAPDLETLLDFETNVENAAQTFLATDTGLTASSINLTLDQDDLELPRLEVRFDLGEALDPPDPKTTGSAELEYRKYSGTFNVIVMTRASEDGTDANHRSYRAKVRKSLLLNALNFSGGLPDAMVVEGAGTTAANGVYLREGSLNNSAKYSKDDISILKRLDSDITPAVYRYVIFKEGVTGVGGTPNEYYYDSSESDSEISGENVPKTPDLVSTWRTSEDGAPDPPTVRRATWADIDAAGIDPLTVPILIGTEYLPYYDVNYLRPTGTDYTIDGDIAASTLTFSINLVIRNDAWPT